MLLLLLLLLLLELLRTAGEDELRVAGVAVLRDAGVAERDVAVEVRGATVVTPLREVL